MEQEQIEIRRLTVDQERFLRLPLAERSFLISGGHILNEIGVLNRFLVLSMHARQDLDVYRDARFVQMSVALRLLVGKLWEAWLCFKKIFYETSLKDIKASLDATTQDEINSLGSRFAQSSVLSSIRDQASFHYSPDGVRDWIEKYPREDPLHFNFGISDMTNCFLGSEEVVMGVALENLDSDPKVAFEKILEESIIVNRLLRKVIVGIVRHILYAHFADSSTGDIGEAVEIPAPLKAESCSIPALLRS